MLSDQNTFWWPPAVPSCVTYFVIFIQLQFKCKVKEVFFEQKWTDYFLVLLLFYEFGTSRY